MTAAAIATMATVEAATITNCLLSRRTRKKPSGGGDFTSLMAAVAAIRGVDKLPPELGSDPHIF